MGAGDVSLPGSRGFSSVAENAWYTIALIDRPLSSCSGTFGQEQLEPSSHKFIIVEGFEVWKSMLEGFPY